MLSLGRRSSSRRGLTLVLLALSTHPLGLLFAEFLRALVEDVGLVRGDVGERGTLFTFTQCPLSGGEGTDGGGGGGVGGSEGGCPLSEATGKHDDGSDVAVKKSK